MKTVNSKFCKHCGFKIESRTNTCHNFTCKCSGLPLGALYCTDCGTKLQGKFKVITETVNNVVFEMVPVKGGYFFLGSENGKDDDKPVRKVTISSFYIGKYPVTQELWRAVMGTNPSKFKGNRIRVESVGWDD